MFTTNMKTRASLKDSRKISKFYKIRLKKEINKNTSLNRFKNNNASL